MSTEMWEEVLECRHKKAERKETALEQQVTAAEQDYVTTPSLKSPQPHQLNNAYQLASQLAFFF